MRNQKLFTANCDRCSAVCQNVGGLRGGGAIEPPFSPWIPRPCNIFKIMKNQKIKNYLQQTVADAPLVMVAKARPQNSSAFPGISVPTVDFLGGLHVL